MVKKQDPPTVQRRISRHKTFLDFRACVKDRTRVEFIARMSYSEDVPYFSEFHVADGVGPLRHIWDNLAEFRAKGRAAIQVFLAVELEGKFPQDNSAIIASAICTCLMLHGEEMESDDCGAKEVEQSAKENGAEQAVTFEDIKTVLNACDGEGDISEKRTIKRKAVDLWKQLRESLGKDPTQKALEIHVGVDHSDFHKWLRCESKFPDGSSTDIEIRKALTTDWD